MSLRTALLLWGGLLIAGLAYWIPLFWEPAMSYRSLSSSFEDRMRFDQAFEKVVEREMPSAIEAARVSIEESRQKCARVAGITPRPGSYDEWLKQFCIRYPAHGTPEESARSSLTVGTALKSIAAEALVEAGLTEVPPEREILKTKMQQVLARIRPIARIWWTGLGVWLGIGLMGYAFVRRESSTRM